MPAAPAPTMHTSQSITDSSGTVRASTSMRWRALRESFRAPVVCDVLLWRRHGDYRRDGGELEIIELLEVQTALPHVEPLPGFLECVDEELFGERRCVLAGRAVVRAHQIERVVALLRAEAHVAERLTVVRVGELLERDPPVDHAPVHELCVPLGDVPVDEGLGLLDHRPLF